MSGNSRLSVFWVLACAGAVILTGTAFSTAFGDSNAAERSVARTPGSRSDGDPARFHPRSNYVWPFESGPHYHVDDVYTPGVLWTTSGTFRLDRLDIPRELRSRYKLERMAHQYFAVHYDPMLTEEEEVRVVIEAASGTVLESPCSATAVARLNREAHAALESYVGVTAIEPYHPAFKQNPQIGRVPLRDRERALSEVYALDVLLWRGESARHLADRIAALGGDVRKIMGNSLVVELRRVFREFRRVLRTGGLLLVAVKEGNDEGFVDDFLDRPVRIWFSNFSKLELGDHLTSNGFRVRTLEVRNPYPGEIQVGRIYAVAEKTAV